MDENHAYAYLLKSKVLQLLGNDDYCKYAKLAVEYGIGDAFLELGVKCK